MGLGFRSRCAYSNNTINSNTYVYVFGERDNGHTPIADDRASVPRAVRLLSDEVHVSDKQKTSKRQARTEEREKKKITHRSRRRSRDGLGKG